MGKSAITHIEQKTNDASIDIALSTIKIGKQAIIFVNTKRGAESLAEKISLRLKKDNPASLKENMDLSGSVLGVLSKPTKQCTRLSETIKYGIAFHHAGLVSEQRELIELSFKSGIVKIIVATPTLAAGVDLPAFRVIIRDLKRFGLWGMDYIPVLEYEQQAGRAGRPSYDKYGEAICIADTEKSKSEIRDKYVYGTPEEIISKLAAEPILRTYILSLIASEFVSDTNELEDFFSRTFYAQQFGDMHKLNSVIHRMLEQLEEWNFIEYKKKLGVGETGKEKEMDFVSALKMTFKKGNIKIKATLLGRRVSELYLDPYTANFLIANLLPVHDKSLKDKEFGPLSLIHLICSCLEIRPLLNVKVKEYDEINEFLMQNEQHIITNIPEQYDEDYDEFTKSIKTTRFFMEWLDEKDEEFLLEKYDVRPGEINSKKDIADWLLYSTGELCTLMKMHPLIKEASKLRFRLKYGAREELIPLLQLKNIGRVRARIMFNNRIKDISDVKKADLTLLTQLLGKNIALDVKKQVGQDLSPEKVEVKEGKRKGQINLNDYDQ
jgi:helicase